IVSRLGVTRTVDFALAPSDDAWATFAEQRGRVREHQNTEVSCLLVDEAQFLTEQQVDDLLRIAIIDNVPVLAYGIRTDFQTVAFPRRRRLLDIAHSLEELTSICRCGRKAVFNARTIDGVYQFAGDQVAIEDGVDIVYESLCGQCYLHESGGTFNRTTRALTPVDTAYTSGPDADFT